MPLLQPNRTLINHNFEGYKLSPDEPLVCSLELEKNVSVVKNSASQINYEEIRLYSLCNHLTVDYWHGDQDIDHLYFINESWEVMHIESNGKNQSICSEPSFQIPFNALNAANVHNVSLQLPSKNYAVLSDGVDKIYFMDRQTYKWQILYTINYERPCTLLYAICDDQLHNCHCCLVEFYHQGSKTKTKTNWIEIEIAADNIHSCNYNVLTQISSQCVPLFGAICPISKKFILIHEKKLTIEQHGTSNNDKAHVEHNFEQNSSISYENLISEFSWTQNSDTVVVNFNVPYPIKSRDVVFSLTSKDISLGLTDGLVFIKGKLHGQVDVDGCTWVLQDNGTSIELTLEKYQPFHVWSTVVEGCTRGKQITEDVHEVHQRLAHLTSDQWNPQPNTVESQIFQLDRSEDCDEPSENDTMLSVVSPKANSFDMQIPLGCNQWLFNAPLSPHPNGIPAFCLRHDVDAFLWQFQANSELPFTHVTTFDAFGYVQASKRDRKFISCSPSGRFVVICDYTRNIYIYMKSLSENYSFQRIVSFDSETIIGLIASYSYIYVLSNCKIYVIKV